MSWNFPPPPSGSVRPCRSLCQPGVWDGSSQEQGSEGGWCLCPEELWWAGRDHQVSANCLVNVFLQFNMPTLMFLMIHFQMSLLVLFKSDFWAHLSLFIFLFVLSVQICLWWPCCQRSYPASWRDASSHCANGLFLGASEWSVWIRGLAQMKA